MAKIPYGLRIMLEQLGQEAEKIARNKVNYGGCCVYASLISEQLNKLGIRHLIKVESYRGVKPIREYRNKTNNKNLRDWRNAGISFCHVFIKIGSEVYDSSGFRSVGDYEKSLGGFNKMLPGGITLDEAKAFAADPSGWNRIFSRDTIPQLEKLVSDRFSEYVGQRSNQQDQTAWQKLSQFWLSLV